MNFLSKSFDSTNSVLDQSGEWCPPDGKKVLLKNLTKPLEKIFKISHQNSEYFVAEVNFPIYVNPSRFNFPDNDTLKVDNIRLLKSKNPNKGSIPVIEDLTFKHCGDDLLS